MIRPPPRRRLAPLLSLGVGSVVLAALPGGHLLTAILGISFLIFVHEWGHFIACRLVGVRTETFSIGFGPRLFGWEKGRDGRSRFTTGRRQLDPADHAMDFRVALIPLGGYVKMAGELPGESASGGGGPAPDEFPAKSASARIFIVSAGVIMNFLTAAVFYALVLGSGVTQAAPVVGAVMPGDGAWAAGIQPGDRLLEVDGEPIESFRDFVMETVLLGDSEAHPIVVERGGERLRVPVRPVYNEALGFSVVGIQSAARLVLGTGAEAFEVGPTDAVTVAGIPAVGGSLAWRRIVEAFAHGVDPVPVVAPDGRRFELALPAPAEGAGPARTMIGIAPYGPPEVRASRGRAAEVLAGGDRILAVESAGERRALASQPDWAALPYGPPIDALIVLKADREVRLEVPLATAAEIATFLDDVALVTPRATRLVPLRAGHVTEDPDPEAGPGAVLRYATSPALEAGLKPGDRVVRVGATGVNDWAGLQREILAAPAGEPLVLSVRDDTDLERQVTVRPARLERHRLPAELRPALETHAVDGVLAAAGAGVGRAVYQVRHVFRTIGALFAGDINFNKSIAGPITLVTETKRQAEGSWVDLLNFLAYISVMLAVLNILPIPVLDGGHLLFILIEKLKGRPLKEETIYTFQKVGLLLLLVLMFFAFKNDITRLLP